MSHLRAGLLWISQTLTRKHKKAILWSTDILLAPLSLFVVVLAIHHSDNLSTEATRYGALAFALAIIAGATSLFLRLPWVKLKSYETHGSFRLLPLAVVVTLALWLLSALTAAKVPTVGILAFGFVFISLAYASRLIMLQILLWALRSSTGVVRVLIYGAGSTGVQLASALTTHDAIKVVGFVDDDPSMRHLRIAGVRIFSADQIEYLVRDRGVSRIILAIPSSSRPRQAKIARAMQEFGIEVQIVPSFAQLVGAEASVDRLTLLTPEQFLGRVQLNESLSDNSDFYRDKVVMVTGAGGSIGSELCRQLVRSQPKKLILFEVSEHALYQIDQELSEQAMALGVDLCPVLGSVTEMRSINIVLQNHNVEVVLHAAAYKHVPLVEANPLAGVTNNVMGTRILAEACARQGVKRFLLISTDKAVRPTNVMGASKRLAEMVIQSLASRHVDTQFAIVRFGNVLGSSGSVIPLFKTQIARGGPVTLTHNEVTRFFMTIPEAVSLVLLAGALQDQQGLACADVFVLDMGEPVRIRDLAEKLIREAGYSVRDDNNPEGDIEIKVTGLRPGEKLYEELLIGEDMANTPHPKIKRAAEAIPADVSMLQVLHDLSGLISVADVQGVRDLLFKLALATPANAKNAAKSSKKTATG